MSPHCLFVRPKQHAARKTRNFMGLPQREILSVRMPAMSKTQT
jgi:hypothetical protein